MITVFLGAGFSVLGGVPLASRLFDSKPIIDRVIRKNLIYKVQAGWNDWQAQNEGTPEEYLAYLKKRGDKRWYDALWYVGLIIALGISEVENVGNNPTITKHNITRTTGLNIYEEFWSIIFRRTHKVTVITTNYDILAERGIRHEPRPRVPRPGFNYGDGFEFLEGSGYPSYAHIRKVQIKGSVPLLKIHGSVSWSIKGGKLIKYYDCRPALRGDPAIIAPVTTKEIPVQFNSIWEKAEKALSSSEIWIIIGYSLPEYDILVRDLFQRGSKYSPCVHIFNPDQLIARRFEMVINYRSIETHPGLPYGLTDLAKVVDTLN